MSDVFSKAILKVGTYHSPDGVVVVTPERLRHWEQQAKKLQSVGYAIPSHFDHSNEIDLLEPIKLDVLERKVDRSAQKTVGRLSEFRVAPDGQSAEILLQTLTPTAREAVESNAVYVSPVIFPEWKDGAGNQYQDVITSIDLVDHPVDYSQSSFVPAIRMGLSSKPYILSGIRMSLKPVAKSRAATSRKARMNSVLVRLGLEKPKDDEEQNDAPPAADDAAPAGDAPPADDAAPPVEDAQAPSPGDETGDGDYDVVDQVLDLLHEFGCSLPEDTNDENLVPHLRVALTALLRSGQEQASDGGDPTLDPALQSTQPQAQAPMIATMSLQGPAKTAFEWAENQYRESIKTRLRDAVASGRCTPAEADKHQRELSAVRLSLGADGKPAPSRIETFLEDREAVPQGTFWTAEQRTQAAQKLSIVEPRKEWNSRGGQSMDEIEAAVNALM